jgi:hypothetical protein
MLAIQHFLKSSATRAIEFQAWRKSEISRSAYCCSAK